MTLVRKGNAESFFNDQGGTVMRQMRKWLLNLIIALLLLSAVSAGAETWQADRAAARLEVTIAMDGVPPVEAEEYAVRLVAADPVYPLPEGGAGGVWVSAPVTTQGTVPIVMTYDNVGVFSYTVSQVIPAAGQRGPGMEYETTEYELRVTVFREDGVLKVAQFFHLGNEKLETVTYTNRRRTGSVTVSKIVAAPSDKFVFKGKQFHFNMTLSQPADASQWPEGVQTADGQTLTFDLENGESVTLTGLPIGADYTVTEDPEPGYNEKLDGTPMVMSGQIDAGNTPVFFLNEYATESNQVILGAYKQLTGRPWKDGESFTFSLIPEDGAPVNTSAANATKITVTRDTAFAFAEITFTEPGNYMYYIAEDLPPEANYDTQYTVNGLVYDTHVLRILVSVRDNGDGSMTAMAVYLDGERSRVFSNNYQAEGELSIPVTKRLTGRVFQPGDSWRFSLSGSTTGVPMPEETEITIQPESGAEYAFEFGPIVYNVDDIGETYTYTVREDTQTTVQGVTNALTATVTVTVSDNGDGTLSLTPAYTNYDGQAGGASLTNRYTARGSIALNVTKTLEGRALTAGQFTFRLTDAAGNVLDTATNTAAGRVAFRPLLYTEADVDPETHQGRYTYRITEVAPAGAAASGYAYDAEPVDVQVTLTDDTKGKITAEQTFLSGKTAFVNRYAATGQVTLTAMKALTGADLTAGRFAFALRDANGSRLQRAVNAANGAVTFAPITYTQADLARSPILYTIVELNDQQPNIAYDTHTLRVSVALRDNGDGTITATPTYTGGQTFFNTFTGRPYTVTVIYLYWNTNVTAAPTVVETHIAGESYNIASPNIPGYRRTRARVSGVQPERDIVEYVYYIPDNLIIDEYDTPLGLGQVYINVGDCLE